MTQTVTAAYTTIDAARNAVDGLLADGFDREKVFPDREAVQIEVMVPDSVRRETEEVLNRHGPREIWSHAAT